MKRNDQPSHGHPKDGGQKKAKISQDEDECESNSEGIIVPTQRIPAMITKAGIPGHKRNGVVEYTLKRGKTRRCLFFEEQSVANGYSLQMMRQYTSCPTLTFPFKVGQPVSIIEETFLHRHLNGKTHRATIEFGGGGVPGAPLMLEDISGKDIPNFDGKEVIGKIHAFEKDGTGVAWFSINDDVRHLTLIKMQEIIIGGSQVPKSMFSHVAFVGMSVNLKITSSNSTKIPWIYYTAEANVNIPFSHDDGIVRKKPEIFRGVITKVSDDGPTMISCFFEENVVEKFFVICENATANMEPVSKSGVHFAEGIRVRCSINFKCDRDRITKGCAYEATVDLPVFEGKVVKLQNKKGSEYPTNLWTKIDNQERSVIVRKSEVNCDGKKIAGPIIPKGYYRVGMVVKFNHLWKCNNGLELHTSLDLTASALSQVSPSIDGNTGKKERFIKPKMTTSIKGHLTAARENEHGLFLPSEATAIVDGNKVNVQIPPALVSVNTKFDVWLPKHLIKVGEEIRLYNMKFCEESQVHQAEVRLSFVKIYLQSELEKHAQRYRYN